MTASGTAPAPPPGAVDREPSAALREELARESRSLEAADPATIIRWAVNRFGPKLTMATAFGPEGCLIIHWLAAIAPATHVFNLDTGYQFPETLDLRDRLARPQARAPHAPVQLIVPTRDRYVSPAVTRAVEAWVSHYWRHEVDAGHWLPLRRPDWVADCIARFANYVESGHEPAELQQARVAGTLAPA